MVVAAMMGATDKPTRADWLTYASAMLLLTAVGVVGAVLHIRSVLIAQTAIIPERFLRGAPFLAPLLFSNMGMLGLVVLLDPKEE